MIKLLKLWYLIFLTKTFAMNKGKKSVFLEIIKLIEKDKNSYLRAEGKLDKLLNDKEKSYPTIKVKDKNFVEMIADYFQLTNLSSIENEFGDSNSLTLKTYNQYKEFEMSFEKWEKMVYEFFGKIKNVNLLGHASQKVIDVLKAILNQKYNKIIKKYKYKKINEYLSTGNRNEVCNYHPNYDKMSPNDNIKAIFGNYYKYCNCLLIRKNLDNKLKNDISVYENRKKDYQSKLDELSKKSQNKYVNGQIRILNKELAEDKYFSLSPEDNIKIKYSKICKMLNNNEIKKIQAFETKLNETKELYKKIDTNGKSQRKYAINEIKQFLGRYIETIEPEEYKKHLKENNCENFDELLGVVYDNTFEQNELKQCYGEAINVIKYQRINHLRVLIGVRKSLYYIDRNQCKTVSDFFNKINDTSNEDLKNIVLNDTEYNKLKEEIKKMKIEEKKLSLISDILGKVNSIKNIYNDHLFPKKDKINLVNYHFFDLNRENDESLQNTLTKLTTEDSNAKKKLQELKVKSKNNKICEDIKKIKKEIEKIYSDPLFKCGEGIVEEIVSDDEISRSKSDGVALSKILAEIKGQLESAKYEYERLKNKDKKEGKDLENRRRKQREEEERKQREENERKQREEEEKLRKQREEAKRKKKEEGKKEDEGEKKKPTEPKKSCCERCCEQCSNKTKPTEKKTSEGCCECCKGKS